MKTTAMWMVAVLMAFISGCADTSGTSGPDKVQAPAPELSGNDVREPKQVMQTIQDFDSNASVYAACDLNGWFSSGPVSEEVKSQTRMDKQGDWYLAKNMKGVRHHPVQLDAAGKPKFARLEDAYDLSEPWIDMSGGSPALLVR